MGANPSSPWAPISKYVSPTRFTLPPQFESATERKEEMRTRFQNIDFFAPSSSSTYTLGSFLKLPIPHLPPPPPPLSFSVEELLLFPDPFADAASLEHLERFPIDGALSKFLSEVIPRKINDDSQDAALSFGSDEASSFSEAVVLKDNETAEPYEDLHNSKVLLFEPPEPLEFLESICLPVDGTGYLFEVPEVVQNLDFRMPDIEMHCPEEIRGSVYLVESETPYFDIDQKAPEVEVNDGSVQEKAPFCHISFPILEVDEISLRNVTNLTAEDKLLSFLEDIESLWIQNDSIVTEGSEMLGSMECDILDTLSNHCLSNNCAASEMAYSDLLLQMDNIIIGDMLMTIGNSGDHSLDVNFGFFEEFKFLDEDTSQLYDAFLEMEKTDDSETCECIFSEDAKSKSFSRLIVSRELALADDMFKSLPIPIILDDEKTRSINAIFKETLDEIKSLTFSASDGIYLDWHLLKEDPCNCKIFSPFQNMLKELDLLSTEFAWEYSVNESFVTDIVFSDDVPNGPEKEDYKDLASILSEGNSNRKIRVGASSNSLHDEYQKPGNEETLAEKNYGKASLHFRSMSKFNDLEFFLNPGKANPGPENCEFATNAINPTAKYPKEGEPHCTSNLHENVENRTLEQLQTHVSVQANANTSSEAADKAQSFYVPMPVPYKCHALESEKTKRGKLSLPEVVIIVNTQNCDKEMIVSRRSTYQKVLAMEKEGAQIVERDLNLPVDIVMSSALCLLWYDCRNIGKKATALDEASSSMPSCMENIATNVLTLLSFSFSSCILVFEGELSFLSTVMEYSDVLHAAAASLGIDVQLFCSYSTESTDEIILGSISYVAKVYKGLYPKMPESETLAESFLTKFPSIHPLTANAILSSEGLLFEFLVWPHERKIHAVEKYHVPQESIILFSVLGRYGEREDSKSIMTDCSSSVSSGPDSDKCQLIDPESKRRKCIPNPQEMEIHVDGIRNSEPQNPFADGIHGPSREIQGDDSWTLVDSKIPDELKPPCSSLEGLFGKKDGSNTGWMMDSYTLSEPRSSRNLRSGEIKRPTVSVDDKLLGQNRRSELSLESELGWFKTNKSEDLHGDTIDDVLDLTDRPSLDSDIPSVAHPMGFSSWLPGAEQNSRRKSRAMRKLSFGESIFPTFPTAAEVNSYSGFWTAARDQGPSLQEKAEYPNGVKLPLEHQKMFLEDAFEPQSAGSAKGLSFKVEMPHYGKTPLSRAVNSAYPQPGSPWTIEFLNRIREKSKLRKQSLPSDAYTPASGYSENVNKIMKRRSPSILEFFKYQGGNTPRKLQEQKKQKRSLQLSSSSKNERTSAISIFPTGTPLDKRAKQTLSFTPCGSGNQTRLVWSDGSAHRLPKKFRPGS